MASMTCRHFHEELERWMDGERSAAAQAHIRGCQACNGLIADLKAIEVEAHRWSAPLVEPPERVWVSLRNQLEAEGIIKTAPAETVASVSEGGWFSRLFPSTVRPVLAGAYLAALVAVVTAGVATTHRAPILHAQLINTDRFPTAPVISSPRIPNPAVSDLNRNLAIVDNQIAMCEKSLNEEPDNEVAKDFLANAYQQKAELISEISERGVPGQ